MLLSLLHLYQISHKAEKEFFAVWQLIGWIADTLIFFIGQFNTILLILEIKQFSKLKINKVCLCFNFRSWIDYCRGAE